MSYYSVCYFVYAYSLGKPVVGEHSKHTKERPENTSGRGTICELNILKKY